MPRINGRFYVNPAYGNAVERARVASAGNVWSEDDPELEQQPAQQYAGKAARRGATRSQPGENDHWVTINGIHVLIHEGQGGHVEPYTREKIVTTAKRYGGSSAWAFATRKDDFGPGTDKCNKFVYDVTREAGARAVVVGSDGKLRPPLAAEWADPNTLIPGWRVLRRYETPQPGDVAAYKLSGGGIYYSGHSGIVSSVDSNGTVHAIAAHEKVVGPDDKFNSTKSRVVTYRRFTGDQ